MEISIALFSLAVLIVIGVCVGLVLAVVGYKRLFASKMQDRRHDAKELQLKAMVAEKAARRSDEEIPTEDENLTDSGIFSVLEMMDALVSGGNLDEAEKLALNAIHNHRDRANVPVNLAVIYFKAGRKSAFLAVVRNMSSKKLDVPEDAWRRLAVMGLEIAPEEPVFSALLECDGPSNSATFH